MKILHLHPGADTGGTSIGAKAALEAAGDEVRVFVKSFHRFEYPQATFWDADAVDESIDWADVVTVHNESSLWASVSRGRRKPLFVMHHGSRFRRNPGPHYRDAASIGATQLVSTVDLLLSVPGGGVAYWMPQVLDAERMAAVAAEHAHAPNKPISIAHAPTNRAIKGTRHIVRAVRSLNGRATMKMIEREPWARCLALKASADIFVDQIILGYGNNAIECWGMGMPVVAGASEPVLGRMRQTYGRLPFAAANASTLPRVIGELVASADLRAEWAATGAEHVRRFHAPAAFASRAHELYDEAIRQVAPVDMAV